MPTTNAGIQIQLTRVIQQNSFWVSIGCHLLLLISFSLVVVSSISYKKTPELYVPSYIYQQNTSITAASVKSDSLKALSNTLPIAQSTVTAPSAASSISQNQQAVHMIGEKKLDKPLIKLLGQALAQKIVYPKSAIDFNVKGVAYVGFIVHPNGKVTDGRLVRTSGAEVLDKSALAAVNTIPPIENVANYLKEPTYLVVGIIYG